MNRKALVRTRGGQIFPAFVSLEFRPEAVNASGASTVTAKCSFGLILM